MKMNLWKNAMLVVALLLSVSFAWAGEEDIQALRARLAKQDARMAAQDARLNDLESKMMQSRELHVESVEGVTSLRKNATVTLGGTYSTRYAYRDSDFKTSLTKEGTGTAADPYRFGSRPDNRRVLTEENRGGDLYIKDAKLDIKIDVNEHFDAGVKLDLHDGWGRRDVAGIAQNYWVRWKKIANTGFGLLVGRDALKFGDVQPIGAIAGWNKSNNDTSAVSFSNSYTNYEGNRGEGMFAYHNIVPAHTTSDWTRVTQVNPYWENADGSVRVDFSLFQSIDRLSGTNNMKERMKNGVREYETINYGLGSGTARVIWKPIEGLKLSASGVNRYANNSDRWVWGSEARRDGNNYGVRTASNNAAVNFSVIYRPCFLSRLNLWTQYTHGWNEGWVDNQDSDSLNFGASFDLTDRFTVFAQGDYLRVHNSQGEIWNKSSGWAAYFGAVYTLPYGASVEAGWRHEELGYKNRAGLKHSEFVADTIYAHLQFSF